MNPHTKIKITAGEKTFTAVINNTKTAQDFLALLPLEADLADYVKTEKIFYLPTKLSTEGAPSGAKPSEGDLAYYAPWGNVAIFYKDAAYASILIIIGKIEKDVKVLSSLEDMKIKIEVVQNK